MGQRAGQRPAVGRYVQASFMFAGTFQGLSLKVCTFMVGAVSFVAGLAAVACLADGLEAQGAVGPHIPRRAAQLCRAA